MSIDRVVVHESQARVAAEPSGIFAKFIKDVAGTSGLGSLGLGAIQELVSSRTAVDSDAEPLAESEPIA